MTNLILNPIGLISEIKAKGLKEQYQIVGSTIQYVFNKLQKDQKFKDAKITKEEFFYNHHIVLSRHLILENTAMAL